MDKNKAIQKIQELQAFADRAVVPIDKPIAHEDFKFIKCGCNCHNNADPAQEHCQMCV